MNIFDNYKVANLASANPQGAGWTGSVGTTLYPASTDLETANVIATPINFGDNIFLGVPGQQDGLIADHDPGVKPGWKPTPTNPCPNLQTLCSKKYQYATLVRVTEADPWDAEKDPKFQTCRKDQVYCCAGYYSEKRLGVQCYNAFTSTY